MMTVNEVSRLTGVSIRTLQYYDKIGLLHPADYSDSGYRLYDNACLEKLQQILLFRELEFPLKDIREIISSPDFDRDKALAQQIELLTLKKDHIENLIQLARRIREKEVNEVSFEAFDTSRMKEYAARAKESWGTTEAWQEYEARSAERTERDDLTIAEKMMEIFAEFGRIRNIDPASEKAQALAGKLQEFITKNYYTCTDEIFSGLGKMYGAGGEFTENIDKAGGEGTAAFASAVISIFCGK